jgi:hypothetical protein
MLLFCSHFQLLWGPLGMDFLDHVLNFSGSGLLAKILCVSISFMEPQCFYFNLQ